MNKTIKKNKTKSKGPKTFRYYLRNCIYCKKDYYAQREVNSSRPSKSKVCDSCHKEVLIKRAEKIKESLHKKKGHLKYYKLLNLAKNMDFDELLQNKNNQKLKGGIKR